MPDIIQAEYGQALTVDFELWEPDGTDFEQGAVHAAGDTQIMLDEAAPGNTTNGFADEGVGYSIPLTAAELEAARAVLYIIDQTGPKVWLDKSVHILTYGHPSAHDPRGVIAAGTAQAGDAASITLAAGDTAPVDFYNGCVVFIRSGTGAGQSRVIVDYDDGTKVATVEPNWNINPDATSVYRIFSTPPSAGIETALFNALDDADVADNSAVSQVTTDITSQDQRADLRRVQGNPLTANKPYDTP